MYELVRMLLQATPAVVLLVIFVFALRFKWYWRFTAMFFAGWVVTGVSTVAFWDYSIGHAPTEEARAYLASKDGAPRLFGTMFGWTLGLVYLLAFELLHGLFALSKFVLAKTARKNA